MDTLLVVTVFSESVAELRERCALYMNKQNVSECGFENKSHMSNKKATKHLIMLTRYFRIAVVRIKAKDLGKGRPRPTGSDVPPP